MSDLRYLENVIPADLCSRGQFREQCEKLEMMLRAASQSTGNVAESTTAGRQIEPQIAQILERVILRAKGMVSEEMLVRHQREISVDEIPDYAVTHLLAALGEQELQGLRR